MKGSVTVAAAAAPVLWSFLGYPYEAASMIAALSSCLIVRIYQGFQVTGLKEAALNACITCLSLVFTGGLVITLRPAPLWAIMLGTGLGAIGAGLIKIAEKKTRRIFDDDDALVDDDEAFRRLAERIKEMQ